MNTAALTNTIQASLRAHETVLQGFFASHAETLVALVTLLTTTFHAGGKLLLCGNGGSACDAMHIAGEFVGRFEKERKGLPAIALSADSGVLTSIGNDYGFEQIFARQVEALGGKGDMLIALSTSGSSANVLAALRQARVQGLRTVLFTGEKGASRQGECDLLFVVPSIDTAHIQEAHMVALHMLAGAVEACYANPA